MRKVAKFLGSLWPPLPVWVRLDAAVGVVCVYTAGAVGVYMLTPITVPPWSGFSAVLNAIILGVLLSFRNREAYDRWWEGRRLWGQLVNDTRNLGMKVKALPGVAEADQRALGRLIVGFAVAMKDRLRGGGKLQDVPGFTADTATPDHVPLYLAQRVMDQLRTWRAAGQITDFDRLILDPHARALMDVCGACERIQSTPMPRSYRSLLRHGLVLYLFSTPWLVAEELGWWAVPMVGLLAYFLVGIEFTAEDVEDPFGHDGDDLTLTTYCDTIRRSVAATVGE